MQCLLNESPIEDVPIEVYVQRADGKATVRITNRSEVPIKNGYARFGRNMVINFGSVGGNSTVEFTESTQQYREPDLDFLRGHNTYRGGSTFEFENHTAYYSQGILQRTRAINTYLAKGATVVYVQFEDVPTAFRVKDKPCEYEHRQLVRLVVFPES